MVYFFYKILYTLSAWYHGRYQKGGRSVASLFKIWAKISMKPFSSGIRMSDLDKLLTKVGFELKRTTGSHRHYLHPDYADSLLTIPCRNETDFVKPVYVKNTYEYIMKYNLQEFVK